VERDGEEQKQGQARHDHLLHVAQPKVQGQGRGGLLLQCGEGQGCQESLGVLASTLYCAAVVCWAWPCRDDGEGGGKRGVPGDHLGWATIEDVMARTAWSRSRTLDRE